MICSRSHTQQAALLFPSLWTPQLLKENWELLSLRCLSEFKISQVHCIVLHRTRETGFKKVLLLGSWACHPIPPLCYLAKPLAYSRCSVNAYFIELGMKLSMELSFKAHFYKITTYQNKLILWTRKKIILFFSYCKLENPSELIF